MNPNSRTFIWSTLLTLGLYFSGFLVLLTPLPLIYHALKRPSDTPLKLLLPSLAVVLLVYHFGTEHLFEFYQANPTYTMLFPLPMTEMLAYFSPVAVKTMGTTYFLVFGTIGVGLARALNSEQSHFKRLFWLIAGLFVVVGMITTAIVYPHAELLLADFRQFMNSWLLNLIAMQEKAGADIEQIIHMKSMVAEYVQYSFFMLPFVYFMFLSFLVVLNLVIAKRFFTMHFPFIEKIDLTRFRIPFGFVWIVIVLIMLALLNEKYLHYNPLHYTLLNIGLSLGAVYFIQGFAVVVHFMNTRGIYGLMRLSFYLFIMMMLMFSTDMQARMFLIFVSLGFFENWLDIRKLDAKPNSKTKQII